MKPQPTFLSGAQKTPFLKEGVRDPFLRRNVPEELLSPLPYPLELSSEARFRHLYIPGGTGMGKTTQVMNFIYRDIVEGSGITVIDPKGDLVEPLLDYIPKNRVKDVVYLTMDAPIPFDFLAYSGPTEKDELVEDILYLALRDAGNAPRAKSILFDVLYTLFDSKEPISFLDIVRFLIDQERRDTILETVSDAELKAIWKKGVPSDEKLDPIITRFKKYLRNSVLRTAFGSVHPPLNIAGAMNEKKIVLVNLGGASRAAIDFGSLLFMKLKQEVFRRHSIKPSKRVPHYVYIDEFDQFAHVEDFKKMLTMARGYRISLTLANPSFSDLPESIQRGIGIIGNYICFNLDPHDLSFFKHKYDFEDPNTLSRLIAFYAYYKLSGQRGVLSASLPEPRKPNISFRKDILKNMAELREKYAPSAQSGQNRSGDNASSNFPTIRHTEGNASTDPTSEDPVPTAAPRPKTL